MDHHEVEVNPQMAVTVPAPTSRGGDGGIVSTIGKDEDDRQQQQQQQEEEDINRSVGGSCDAVAADAARTTTTEDGAKKVSSSPSADSSSSEGTGTATASDTSSADAESILATTKSSSPLHVPPPPPDEERPLRVGIVLENFNAPGPAVSGIHSPISNCDVTALVVLNGGLGSSGSEPNNEKAVQSWLRRHHLGDDEIRTQLLLGFCRRPKISVLYGRDGFNRILLGDEDRTGGEADSSNCNSSSTGGYSCSPPPPVVDAVFIVTSSSLQHDLVMAALRANKHVLARDRTSGPYGEFVEQLKRASSLNRMIQSSTMFVHHQRVRTFLECVLFEGFGHIETINAQLNMHYDLLHEVGASLPLQPGDGCIIRLARYCVLISVLMFSRLGSRPVSAKVTQAELCNDDDEESNGKDGGMLPISADCVVRFSDDRVLNCHVEYTAAHTRQVLEVQAHDRYATMTDFVVPHPDGLATYRIYDKELVDEKSGRLEVVKGEALDIMSGPPQDVMMWRSFAEVCRTVETEGYDNPNVRELANIVIQTKRVLMALEQSLHEQFVEVPVTIEEILPTTTAA